MLFYPHPLSTPSFSTENYFLKIYQVRSDVIDFPVVDVKKTFFVVTVAVAQ
jgi:hypothetical protein